MSQPLRADLAAFHADPEGMKNPTVLSVGEARGHGFFLDEKSLDQAARLMIGKSLKSYLNHEPNPTKRTGQEIGYLSGFYREGDKLRAKAFEYFDTFKRQSADLYAKLAELTQKIPDALGFSPVISYSPVWVMQDGRELPAQLGEEAPRGAVRNLPSARILDILSADIVSRPAVNLMGFLSANEPLVDADAEKQATMSKELESKVAALEAQVASLETVTKERDAARAELEAKGKESAAAVARVAELEAAAKSASEQHTAALAEKDKASAAAVAALEAAHVAKLGEVTKAHEAALKAKDKEIADLRDFDARKLGVAPLKVAQLQSKQLEAQLTTPAAKLEHYKKLPLGPERTAFRKKHYAELMAAEQTATA